MSANNKISVVHIFRDEVPEYVFKVYLSMPNGEFVQEEDGDFVRFITIPKEMYEQCYNTQSANQ